MSGSYVNSDTRTDTLNQASAHDTGLYDPNVHDNQIVAMYETDTRANAARDALLAAGVSSSNVQVMDRSSDTMAGGVDYESGNQGLWGSIKSLFMPDEDAHGYAEGIHRGHAMVVVTPTAGMDRSHIIQVLEGTDPIDFDAKLEEWRQSGYTHPGAASAGLTAGAAALGADSVSSTVNRASTTPANYAVNQTTATGSVPAATGTTTSTAGLAATGTAATAANLTDADTIKVVEERLRVGKREVAAGAVRVRSYVVERPVEEQVTLHEERVTLERHPVDRPASTADTAAFQDRTVEVRARSEEAVIGKEARVVEEIGIHKDVADRVETVRDTVRHTEVDVQDDTRATAGVTGTTTATGTTIAGTTKPVGTGDASGVSTPGSTSSGTNAPRK